MAFEKFIFRTNDSPKINIHAFKAILTEFLTGNKNATQSKEAIEFLLDQTLTTDEAQDITNVITYVNNGADAGDKARRLDEMYRVLILAEAGVWYNTPVLLRDRLSWSVEA